jgi:hypothetical protein
MSPPLQPRWFMTITNNPETQIADAYLRDEAFGG